jgi:glycosyltransferase involved in cell wall biosynthesis
MQTSGEKIKLVLFMTRGMSLAAWEQSGMFEREVALYRRLQERGMFVTFITYGEASDLAYADRIPGIRILCNRWGLPGRLYAGLIPFLHWKVLRGASVYKTNQTNGADIALRAARFWRKPLIARCGYMWSDLAAHGGQARKAEAHRAKIIESLVFRYAQKVVVTTPTMRDYVLQNYANPPDKVVAIPNYVLTELFSPDGACPVPNRLCFVGRLSEEKNPLALVEACSNLALELVMAGEGPLVSAIQEQAKCSHVNVKLLGSVPHIQLPALLHSSTLFLLVSPHEGHPKTLLEAMACGLPVIGADSPGIRELICHGETGWLCGTAASSIRAAIQTLLADAALRERLGRNGRRFVVENFALDRIVEMELAVLHEVVAG